MWLLFHQELDRLFRHDFGVLYYKNKKIMMLDKSMKESFYQAVYSDLSHFYGRVLVKLIH